MKTLKFVGMTALLVVVGFVGSAQAGTISLQPVSGSLQAFQTPTTGGINKNDVIPGLWGYLNGNLVLNGTAGVQYLVEFTLVGSESGWTNQLKETQGNTVLTEAVDFGETISYLHTATGGANDYLKFQFETIAGSTQPKLVNGLDPDGAANGFIKNGGSTAPRTFFVSFCIDTSMNVAGQQSLACNTSNNGTTGDIAWLALDDSGAGPNDNHDDWVGYVEVSPLVIKKVPDGGATAGLFGVVWGCVALLRKRFNA